MCLWFFVTGRFLFSSFNNVRLNKENARNFSMHEPGGQKGAISLPVASHESGSRNQSEGSPMTDEHGVAGLPTPRLVWSAVHLT
jgi:hypothetical protein